MITPEEELVDILLDFIIVSANLAKKVNRTIKEKQIKEGGIINGQMQRTGSGNQGSAHGSTTIKNVVGTLKEMFSTTTGVTDEAATPAEPVLTP